MSTHPETPAETWFADARFGLFVHWGLYSLAARHEWVKQRERLDDAHYQRYFDHFRADRYDPRQWARDAKAADMRYAQMTIGGRPAPWEACRTLNARRPDVLVPVIELVSTPSS